MAAKNESNAPRSRARARRRPTLVVAVALASVLALSLGQSEAAAGQSSSNKLSISSAGINVPKRPALIAGLNQQFKSRGSGESAAAAPQPPPTSNRVGGLLAAVGFGPRSRPAPANASAGLQLDRHQQELLAANPDPNLPAALAPPGAAASALTSGAPLTRSDATSSSGADPKSAPAAAPASSQSGGLVQRLLAQASQWPAAAPGQLGEPAASAPQGQRQPDQSAASQQQQQQQSYRNYALIELELKSEHDRRYVQELYANLSAALNEQAQRPQSFSVSPYVDIDFWSFKTALNDQIDIMVSPKSRAFILGQLARARIKHRVKIDDIQARLDQQSISGGGGGAPLALAGGQMTPQAHANYELSGRQSAAAAAAASAGSSLDAAAAQAKLRQQQQEAELNGRQQAQQPAGAWGLANDSLFFENYQRLADINQYLESLVARARDVARVQVIGRSSQGRYLRVLQLGHDLDGAGGPAAAAAASVEEELGEKQQPPQVAGNGGNSNASSIVESFLRRQQTEVRKVGSLWLDGGTHAREWISPATVLYIAFRLADNHAKCARFFDHLRMVAGQQQQHLSGRHEPLEGELEAGSLLDALEPAGSAGASASASPSARQRGRTSELEQRLELLARRPQEVASEHACDLELEQLLRKYTFYVMPVLNPDGYEYSHTHNRLWRKTRSTSAHPIYRHFCLGADPNRNYDARHGSTGSSSHPCSQTYGGATPFTEPETRHQSNFVYAHRDSLKMFISFHSYSQMILLPFSHSKQLAPDHKDLESVGQAAVRAIERTHGTQYKVGPSASILYTASGTASDWAYEKAGIKYSYTIELRDTGTFGFLLPRQQIVPTGEETFNGLLAMIQQMELNDHLLSSKTIASNGNSKLKSSGQLNATSGESNSLVANSANDEPPQQNAAGFVHAPDLDQLRPFGRFRPRPAQLENAIDGSNTWATPQPKMPGVRDRAPGAGSEGEPLDSNNHRLVEDEVVAMNEEEPDAGLAFEGEGELMEPTNNLSVNSALQGQSSDAAAQSAAKLLGHIYAHSSDLSAASQRRQQLNELQGRQAGGASGAQSVRQRLQASQHQLGLSANGRSLINSPPGPARGAHVAPRRESSNSF